jgi:hypothetical protein
MQAKMANLHLMPCIYVYIFWYIILVFAGVFNLVAITTFGGTGIFTDI